MPYPPEHRARTRDHIIRSAQTLFYRHGFEGVSIDGIMAHAGLTRGPFYRYFRKKSDLYAEAIGLALREPPVGRWPGITVDFAAADVARQVIRAYLSREHLDNVDASCPLVGVPSDVARCDPQVKRVFQEVFKGMVSIFSKGLQRDDAQGRQRALAMASICVGGMVIARGLADREYADSLREAAMAFALRLGGWSEGGARASADGSSETVDRTRSGSSERSRQPPGRSGSGSKRAVDRAHPRAGRLRRRGST